MSKEVGAGGRFDIFLDSACIYPLWKQKQGIYACWSPIMPFRAIHCLTNQGDLIL